ncbi:M949_RS01915 family surface polysaccharide biosynthesis protein [Parvicella tangerina]|nr:hypothetical protein [Parvicella tangerina]
MNCTRELISFNFIRNPLVFIVLLEFAFCGVASGQNKTTESTWQLSLDVDNYFSIRDAWSSSSKSVSIIVYDTTEKKQYALSLIKNADEWNHFNFPEDFVALSDQAKNSELPPQDFIFEVRVKRNVEKRQRLYYDPSPNALLQLDFYPFREKLDTTIVWGDLIDAYQWKDKIGDNVVVRSELIFKSLSDSLSTYKKYLYFYHFLRVDDELKLIRKFTDVFGECEETPKASFSLPSIELTDIDRDTIGEISVIYDLYCSGGDTLNYHSKLLLASNGKKFMLDATIDPCETGEEYFVEFAKSSSFRFYPYLLRFMQEKLGNYHQQ